MSEVILVTDFEPIPPIFYPEGRNEPFCHCKLCGKELLDNEEQYIIEKIYKQDLETRQRNIVFELAYCLTCANDMRKEMSAESLQKMEAFFRERSQISERAKGLRDNNLFDVDLWLNNCVINNASVDELEEFQIYAQCQGRDMLFYEYPFMISGKALDEVVDLLSEKTLGFLNDFMLDNIDLPPEMMDLMTKTRRPVFI